MRVPSTAPPAVQQSFREIWAAVDPWIGGFNIDLNGRRILNAGDGVADQDYATVGQVRGLITGPLASISKTGNTPSGSALYGTHAVKVATAPSPIGTFYVETDRGNALYQAQIVSGANAWVWVGGGPLAGAIASLTGSLGTNDTGYRYYASDYNRTFQWTGAAWADAPDQPSRHQIVFFASAPSPSVGWQLCDGSTVNRTTTAGTTTAVTVPDLITAKRFLRSNSSSSGVGGSATTHTHAIDPPSTTSGNDTGAGTIVAAGVGTTVATHTHTHDTDIASFTSGAPSGVGGDNALPPYYDALPYYRL